ncbi:MAG: PIN domain-containing protein [Armatimonadetes bacterium]|nr:PIN domain-containing protein [Armatimonadota bacterium]
MAVYLLDTTEVIRYLRNIPETVTRIRDLARNGHTLGCTCITVGEVYAGMKPREKEKTDLLLDSLSYFEPSRETAKVAGKWAREYQSRGLKLTILDTLIAAVAYQEKALLITDNKKDFPMSEIEFAF